VGSAQRESDIRSGGGCKGGGGEVSAPIVGWGEGV
jgi:hypothetical protein